MPSTRLNLPARLALGVAFGALAGLGATADLLAIATLPLAVVVGAACGLLAIPCTVIGFVPVVLLLDRGYEPPLGASGIDAMEPSSSILLVLPIYLVLVAIGVLLGIVRRRRTAARA